MQRGSKDAICEDEGRDFRTWRTIRTGPRESFHPNRRDERGFPIFVKGTGLGNGWDAIDITERSEEASGTYSKGAAFLQTADDVSSSTIETPLRAASPTTLSRSGKAAASFYSLLPREEPKSRQAAEHDSSDRAKRPVEQSFVTKSVSRNKGDWFIHRAKAHLEQGAYGGPSRMIDLPLNNGQCPLCSAKLPIPLSASYWNVHRSSIAHQIAADGQVGSILRHQSGEKTCGAKRKKAADEQVEGHIVLKASNLGYSALERMGWRKGLGLGRAEWEYGMSGKAKMGSHSAEIITISDEDDDETGLDIGGEEWLARVRQDEELRTAADSASGAEASSCCEQRPDGTGEIAPRQRPLLEPIRVQRRPDRRGIGTSLPATARLSKQKTPSRKDEETSQIRLTKKQRREVEAARREEWKQLRSSLN